MTSCDQAVNDSAHAVLHLVYRCRHAFALCIGLCASAVSMSELKKDLASFKGREARYLNYLCASNYVALFNQSGLEIADIKRRNNTRSPELLARLAEMYPWIDSDDLHCAELEARLIRPVEPEELDAFGVSISTMPTPASVKRQTNLRVMI